MTEIRDLIIELKKNSIDLRVNEDNDIEVLYDSEELPDYFIEQIRDNKQALIQGIVKIC